MIPWLILAVHPSLACPGLEGPLQALDTPSRCATVQINRAWAMAEGLGQTECLARELATRRLPAVRPRPFHPEDPPPPQPSKDTRDYYRAPHSVESDNFVIRWGSDTSDVHDSDVDALLDSFETAWTEEIEERGMPSPPYASSYKFNVYLGDTGNEVPSAGSSDGYFTYDNDYYPMIVISQSCLNSDDDWRKLTAAHEFFHACQSGTGAFVDYYDGSISAWYTEATAVWIESEIYPSDPYNGLWIYAYAFTPQLPVHSFDYPDRGTIEEMHQYSAFIFPQYISEIAADSQLIIDSWLDGGQHDDPMEVLEELLSREGVDFSDVWKGFIAHNADWDYAAHDAYEYYIDYMSNYYRNYEEDMETDYNGSGPVEWAEPPDNLPQRYGYNVIHLSDPDEGTLYIRINGDAQGSEGQNAYWTPMVVLGRGGGEYEYLEVPVSDASGQIDIPDIGGVNDVWLVVGVKSNQWDNGEEFYYKYKMYVETPDDPSDTSEPSEKPGENPVACGCASSGAGGFGAWGLALAGLIGLRRRRE